jgi:4-amino-4-deoxy-L-arabinose transferase-like glycosyltransferase
MWIEQLALRSIRNPQSEQSAIRNPKSAILCSLLLLLISFATFFFRLGELPFVGSDEPRYARIAEEMLLKRHWVTPLLEGRPWLEKPPLYYWLTIPVYAVAGVSETTARLGPSACALFSAFAVWWLGRKLWNPLAGLYSGMILLTTMGFACFGRSASTDMPLTACFTVAMALLCAAAVKDDLPAALVLSAYLFLGMAILAKGPVALILAGGICALYWWLDDRGGSLARWRLAPGVMILAAVVLPWFWLVFRENGFYFISIFFINHNLARFVSDIHHHTQPFYYYVPVLLGLMFPWSGWFPTLCSGAPSWRLPPRRDWSAEALFLVSWAVFPFVFFSLSSSKLPGYILPCLPPLSLLLGKRIARLNSSSLPLPPFARWWSLGVSLGVAGLIPLVFQFSYGGRWNTGFWLALLVAVPALAGFLYARRGRVGAAILCAFLQVLLLMPAVTYLAFPILAAYHSTRNIARQALTARQHGEEIVTYRFFHHTLLYYTGYQVSTLVADPDALRVFSLTHPTFLAIADAARVHEFRSLQGFSITPLGEQGKLRLLRVSHN